MNLKINQSKINFRLYFFVLPSKKQITRKIIDSKFENQDKIKKSEPLGELNLKHENQYENVKK